MRKRIGKKIIKSRKLKAWHILFIKNAFQVMLNVVFKHYLKILKNDNSIKFYIHFHIFFLIMAYSRTFVLNGLNKYLNISLILKSVDEINNSNDIVN